MKTKINYLFTRLYKVLTLKANIRGYFGYAYLLSRIWLRDQMSITWGHMQHTPYDEETRRYTYDLNQESIVFDLGGFEGLWSEKIYSKYSPNIYIFEPIKSYYEGIREKFRDNPKVKVFRTGLSNKNKSVTISIDGLRSSEFNTSKTGETVELTNATDFFEKNKIDYIDLMKINIEGGEYDLLEHMIQSGFINNITNLQIQFHRFIPNAKKRRRIIRKQLIKTHEEAYNVPFVWENWKKRNTPQNK